MSTDEYIDNDNGASRESDPWLLMNMLIIIIRNIHKEKTLQGHLMNDGECGWMNENLAMTKSRYVMLTKISCDLKREQASWNECE